MKKHQEIPVATRQEHSARVLRAFGCGCFDDWSDEPPGEREQRARGAVTTLVTTILEHRGAA